MIMKDSYCLALSFAIDCIQNLKEKSIGWHICIHPTIQKEESVWEKKSTQLYLNCGNPLIKGHAFSIQNLNSCIQILY